MDKSALDLEEILGPRDEQLLHLLSAHEPAVPDDIANYHLSRVGCCATDSAATRLLAVAVQIAFEKAVDEAKVIHASSRGDGEARTLTSDSGTAAGYRSNQFRHGREGAFGSSKGENFGIAEVKEMDMDSLCKALQRNGTVPMGPAFDILLQPLGSESESLGT